MAYRAIISIDNKSAYPVKIVFDFGLMIIHIDLLSAQYFADILLEKIPDKSKTLISSDGPIEIWWASSFSIEIKNSKSGMQEVLSVRHARSLGTLIEEKLFNTEPPESDQTDNTKKRTDDNLRGVFE